MNENENLEARLADLERQVAEIKNMISAQSNKNFDVSVYENVLSDSDMAYLMNVKDVRQADYEINNILARLRKQGVNANLNDLANFIESKKGTSTKNDDSNVSEKIKELASKLTDYDMKYLLSIENPNQTNFLFSSLNARYGASIDDLIAAAKYKSTHMDSVKSESGVVSKEETSVNNDNLFEELDRLDKEYEAALDNSGDVVEINDTRNAVLDAIDKSKVNESGNVSSVVSDNEYPKLDSADMSKLFKIYSKAEADNVYLNLMAEKYGVSKSAFHDMYKANMLKDSKIVENPSKKPEKIPSLDQNYNVKNRSINDVSGVYPFEMSNDSENKKTDDNVEKTQVVDNDSKPLTSTEKTRELPLTVEKLSENGGLEPDTLVRRFVKKIANIPGIKFLVNMHHERKKSSEVVDNYLDNTQLNVGFKTESVEKEKSREEWQKRADEVKKAEKEAAENVAVNDEPEMTKINAR